MNDLLILVDTSDNEIGSATKEEAHRIGQLHRAFSVFIINDGKMLIQKRNINKYHSGGLWANACCSHPRFGETLDEAVPRRMIEEIGFACKVEEVGHFVYRTQYHESLYEFEFDHVFLGNYAGEVEFNEEEIEEVKWITFHDLKKDLVKHPEKYSSWFMIAAPMVLERIEKDA
ncbi:MAG: isopentenyl-diphosphate Delta-isomerase [Schaedlerella sp.]|nr:isopentenyl-diphosphate Delta-isomerase [Schaedlerella sp.]